MSGSFRKRGSISASSDDRGTSITMRDDVGDDRRFARHALVLSIGANSERRCKEKIRFPTNCFAYECYAYPVGGCLLHFSSHNILFAYYFIS